MHGSSFDVRTPHDFLHEMVIPQHEDFERDNSSSRHALLAIILVYHMSEWVHPIPPRRVLSSVSLFHAEGFGKQH